MEAEVAGFFRLRPIRLRIIRIVAYATVLMEPGIPGSAMFRNSRNAGAAFRQGGVHLVVAPIDYSEKHARAGSRACTPPKRRRQ